MHRFFLIFVVSSAFVSAGWAQTNNPFAPSKKKQENPFDDPFGSKPKPVQQKKEAKKPGRNPTEADRFGKMLKEFKANASKKADELARLRDNDRKLEWFHREYHSQLADHDRALAMLLEMAIRADQINRQMNDIRNKMDNDRNRFQQQIHQLQTEANSLNEKNSDLKKAIFQSHDKMSLLENTATSALKHGDDQTRQDTLQNFLDALSSRHPRIPQLNLSREFIESVFANVHSENDKTRRLAVRLAIQLDSNRALKMGYQDAHLFWHPIESTTGENLKQNTRRALRDKWSIFVDADSMNELAKYVSSDLDVKVIVKAGLDDKVAVKDFDIENVSISTILKTLGEKCGFRHVVRDNVVELHPPGSAELLVTLNYRVDGLISKECSVEKLIELIHATQLDERKAKVVKVSDSQIMVVGDEEQQSRIGELLGKLPRSF